MKKVLVGGLIALLFAALLLGAWLWWEWRSLNRPVRLGDRQVNVDIPPGATAGDILDRLAAAGVFPDSVVAELYYRFALDSPPLQAGEYSFTGDTTPRSVLDKLIAGDVVTRPLVIIEGFTVEETAAEVESQGFGAVEAFLAAASPEKIQDLDPEATDLEGYLFPDTYHFPRTASPDDIVDTMIGTFRKRIAALQQDHDPPPLREWVTLASIVEKETQVDEERALVAGVYRNRLDRGMGLYADPTIIYALKKAGTWDGNLKRSHLQMDSPYNTYLVPGLPPGPICSPGLASLEAAADPSSEPYYYFVSRNDGTHVFSSTLREHNRNVERWQRQYWRERWRREAQASAAADDNS